jgi:hypothetical protein
MGNDTGHEIVHAVMAALCSEIGSVSVRGGTYPITTICWLTETTVDDSLLSVVCTGTTVMSWGSIRGTPI